MAAHVFKGQARQPPDRRLWSIFRSLCWKTDHQARLDTARADSFSTRAALLQRADVLGVQTRTAGGGRIRLHNLQASHSSLTTPRPAHTNLQVRPASQSGTF